MSTELSTILRTVSADGNPLLRTVSSNRNTVLRGLHDLGAASWFGGSLMGAVALNGASKDITDPEDRARVSAAGWARWSPVALASIAAHLVGGAGLLLANRERVVHQSGVTANTVAKTALTGLAVASTAYSASLGAKVAAAGPVPAEAGAVPAEQTPRRIAAAQQQLRALQWVNPALTAAIVLLGAQQGEQQRPSQILLGAARTAARRAIRRSAR
jgi:hypothetical protein